MRVVPRPHPFELVVACSSRSLFTCADRPGAASNTRLARSDIDNDKFATKTERAAASSCILHIGERNSPRAKLQDGAAAWDRGFQDSIRVFSFPLLPLLLLLLLSLIPRAARSFPSFASSPHPVPSFP